MSLETWKAEYYPVEAGATREWGLMEIVEHSLRKWRGLTPEAMATHGVERLSEGLFVVIQDRVEYLRVDNTSCALCIQFICRGGPCTRCPVYQALGRRCDDGDDSPYFAWVDGGDAQPMIAALERALQLVGAESKR